MPAPLEQATELILNGDWQKATPPLLLAAAAADDGLAGVPLERLRFAMLAAAVRDPAGAMAALQDISLQTPDGPATITDAVNLQCMDACWRLHGPRLPAAQIRWLAGFTAELEARHGRSPATALWQGALCLRAGNRAGAYRHYRDAAALAPRFGGLARMFVGAGSVRPHEQLFDWADAPAPGWPAAVTPVLNWRVKISGQASSPVILFSADPVYFKNFAADVVGQLNALGSSVDLHFHVTGWDADCDALVNGLRSGYPGSVSITWEPYRYVRDRTFFATVRFLRVHALMRALGRAVYITDIDNRFVAAPEVIFDRLAWFSVGFKRVPTGTLFPWWAPSAANMFLKHDADGLRVAELLERYVRSHFAPQRWPASWWFDQLALNEVLLLLDTRFPETSFGDLGNDIYILTAARGQAEVADRKRVGADASAPAVNAA